MIVKGIRYYDSHTMKQVKKSKQNAGKLAMQYQNDPNYSTKFVNKEMHARSYDACIIAGDTIRARNKNKK